MKHKWNRNCRSFIGTYPCEISVAENLLDCTDCSFYEPIQKRILIIKLGALGDVLRTIPILKGIKEKYGYETHITWLIEKGSKELLYNIPEIDRIFEDTPENIQRIKQEKFDILLSLEIDAPGTVIANTIDADEKYGYFLDKDGHPSLFNKEATDYLEMALSNKLKLNNKKTYQEHIFDLCCIPYKKQTYSLQLTEKEKQYAAKFFQENNIDANKKIIGINVGSAGRWSSKNWAEERIIELIKLIKEETTHEVLLLGGPNEPKKIENLKEELKKHQISIKSNNTDNSLREFSSIINKCNLIITGDSLALHIAVGLQKKVIVLFNCTSPTEVEEYGVVHKVINPLLEKKLNLYTDEYNKDLTKGIKAENVFETLNNITF